MERKKIKFVVSLCLGGAGGNIVQQNLYRELKNIGLDVQYCFPLSCCSEKKEVING